MTDETPAPKQPNPSTPTPRLLPWTSPEGKPCLVLGDGTGFVSRLADDIEAEQLCYTAELRKEARRVLDGRSWTTGELQLLAVELTEALDAVQRIAESRGERLVLNRRSGCPQGCLKEPELGPDLVFRGVERP
ncbi:hypothetical protein AB0G35_04405 [Streptomyces sp. NPDC021749]|uniref:hypothetical protein n=1 Tax=Streptomyces sp. NPDC021749 TaxID=3154905 RepID=UPI0033CB0F75